MKKFLAMMILGVATLCHGEHAKHVVGGEVFKRISSALIIIQHMDIYGNVIGSGSGFTATDVDGQTWIYTNEHVVRMGIPLRCSTIDGRIINIGNLSSIEVAANRDLARIRISEEMQGLKISMSPPSINDPIVVYGNSDGASVITELRGKVLGVAAEKIEISAEVVGGNSGSPIIDGSGDVVGVVSLAVRKSPDWVKQGTRFTNVRRFGEAFQNVEWESLSGHTYSTYSQLHVTMESYLNWVYEDFKILSNKQKVKKSSNHVTVLFSASFGIGEANAIPWNPSFEWRCVREYLRVFVAKTTPRKDDKWSRSHHYNQTNMAEGKKVLDSFVSSMSRIAFLQLSEADYECLKKMMTSAFLVKRMKGINRKDSAYRCYTCVSPILAHMKKIMKDDELFMKERSNFEKILERRVTLREGDLDFPSVNRLQGQAQRVQNAYMKCVKNREMVLILAQKVLRETKWPTKRIANDARELLKDYEQLTRQFKAVHLGKPGKR